MAKKNSTDSTKDEESKDDQSTEVDEKDSQAETDADEVDTEDEDQEETDDDSDDSEDEDEEDESDKEEEDSEGFKKRFTQIKGETSEEYLKNLEETYLKSSDQGVKLNKKVKDLEAVVDRVNQLIATNPDLAKQLKGEEDDKTKTPKDPALAWAESQRDKVWQKQYDKFHDRHPEIETDPELADALNTKLAIVKEVTEKTEGRLVDMGEGLEMAWKLLGKDDTQETVRMAAKDSASKGKSASGKKTDSTGKVKFTDAQVEMMMNLRGVSRNDAIKALTEYNS